MKLWEIIFPKKCGFEIEIVFHEDVRLHKIYWGVLKIPMLSSTHSLQASTISKNLKDCENVPVSPVIVVTVIIVSITSVCVIQQ